MTLKEFLDDITVLFKDKNVPLDEIKMKFFIKEKLNLEEINYTGGYKSGDTIHLTFEQK